MTTAVPVPCRREPLRDHVGLAVRALITIAVIAVSIGVPPASAHEVLDAESAGRFPEKIERLNAVVAKGESAEERAEALYTLGQTVDRITDLLNRDLGSHGELGLATTVLVNELKGHGIALSFWPEANRYKSYLAPFERYVALHLEGPRGADALFRVLQGRFYDSFVYDPFQLVGLDWRGIVAQTEDAQDFLALYPDYLNKEEAFFILAVDYARAAREAPDGELARAYRGRARATLKEFHETYPDSLRAAAARALLQSLPAAD